MPHQEELPPEVAEILSRMDRVEISRDGRRVSVGDGPAAPPEDGGPVVVLPLRLYPQDCRSDRRDRLDLVSPIESSLTRLRHSGVHGLRFADLLWERRPHLVSAVALYRDLSWAVAHPDVFRVTYCEPQQRRAKLQAQRTDPGSSGAQDARFRVQSFESAHRILGRWMLQLRDLGWGGWELKDDASGGPLQLTRPKGGGEPMPCWMLPVEPEEVDGDAPEDPVAWWTVDVPEEMWERTRRGKTLWTYSVEAILDALDLRDESNTTQHRKQMAEFVPDVWRDRRATGSRRNLARTVERIQQRY